MKRALISVYNKEGIVDFAKELVGLGWEILASGGTAKALAEGGVKVKDAAEISGRGAVLGHRVVTLTPEIHGGLMASEEQREELNRLGWPRIDLVCVDFYPLKEAISEPGATRESVVAKTDIGGPAMIRSAAKGRRVVIVDASDRWRVIEWLKSGEPNRENFITELVAKAEGIIADYCLVSANFHSNGKVSGLIGAEAVVCKYGENAWQARLPSPAAQAAGGQVPAALCFPFAESSDPLSISNFKLVFGVAPSYNNWCDLDRLLQTITHIAAIFDLNFGYVLKIAVGVKHGNACGAAVGDDTIGVLRKMIDGDPLALFGGMVMTNFSIGEDEARCLINYKMDKGKKRILDGMASSSFSEAAKKHFARREGKCRLLVNAGLGFLTKNSLDGGERIRPVRGGFLKQPNYTFVLDFGNSELKKTGQLTSGQEKDLALAWAIGSTSNSNTITLARDGYLIASGVGQQDRVGACKLALERARRSGHETKGAVAYSDSFFPFVDGPEILAGAGISAIFASSGSVNDKRVEDFCKQKGIVLYSIPDALCRGFFGH